MSTIEPSEGNNHSEAASFGKDMCSIRTTPELDGKVLMYSPCSPALASSDYLFQSLANVFAYHQFNANIEDFF